MNYLDILAAKIQRAVKPAAAPQDVDLPLYRLYAVLLLAKGEQVTADDVHNAWAAAAAERDPENQHLVPFDELLPAIQRKDQEYVDAIHAVATQMKTVHS